MSNTEEILLNDLVLSVKKINDIEKLENVALKGIGNSKVRPDSNIISHLQYLINTYFQNFNPDDMSHKYLSTLFLFIKRISKGIDNTYNWDLTKNEYALLLESSLRSARIYLKVNPKRFSFLLHIVCDTAQILASKSAIMKNALIKEMSVCLLKLLVHTSVVIKEKFYLFKTLELLLNESDKTLRAELCWKVRRYLCRLVEYLHTIGDYLTQCECMAVIFLYTTGKMETRNKIASYFRNPELEKEFLSIPNSMYEIGCRKFLNSLNKMQGSNASVFSLECLHVFMGRIEVFKPEHPEYTDFWIDINVGMQRITFYCNPNSLKIKEGAAVAGWETIVINSEDVEHFDLLPNVIDIDNSEIMKLTIWLRNPCNYRKKTSQDIVEKTKIITIHFKRSDLVTELKNNVFPNMFGKSVVFSESEINIIDIKKNTMTKYRSRQMNINVKKANISSRKTEWQSKASHSSEKATNEYVNKNILKSQPQVDEIYFTNSADSIKEMYRKLSTHKNVKYSALPGCKKEPVLSQIIEIQESEMPNADKDENISESFYSNNESCLDNSVHNAVKVPTHKPNDHCTKEECKMTETSISEENKTISKNKLLYILNDWNQSLIEETPSINAKEEPVMKQKNSTDGIAYTETSEQKSGNFCNKPEEIIIVPTNMYSQPIYANNNENKGCKSKVINKKALMHSKKCKSRLQIISHGCNSPELKGSSVVGNVKDGELLGKIHDDPLKGSTKHSHNLRSHPSSMSKTCPKTKDIAKEIDVRKLQQSIGSESSDTQNEKSLVNETDDIVICESISSRGDCKMSMECLSKLKCSRDKNMKNKENISVTDSSKLNKNLAIFYEGTRGESNVDYHTEQQPVVTEVQLHQQSFKINETGVTSAFSTSEIEIKPDGETNKSFESGDKCKKLHNSKTHFLKTNEMNRKGDIVDGHSMNKDLRKDCASLENISKDVYVPLTEIKPKQMYNVNQVFDSTVNKFPKCKENLNNRSDVLSTNVSEVNNTLGNKTNTNSYEHLDSDNSSSFDFIFPNTSTKIRDIFKVSGKKILKTTKTVESVITLRGRKVVAQRDQTKGQAPAKKRKLFCLNEGEINENGKTGVREVNWSKETSTKNISKQRKKQLPNLSKTSKKPSVANKNGAHNPKVHNETFESKLSVFSDFSSEDESLTDFLQKLVRPTNNKHSNKKQKYISTNVQKEKDLASSDEIFKNRKLVKQVKSHKTEGRFKTDVHNFKREEQKQHLENTSGINIQSNINVPINTTFGTDDYQMVDEFDKLFAIKTKSKNQFSRNTIENNINIKCTNELKKQNISCLKGNNSSNKITTETNKFVQNNDIIPRKKLKKCNNVAYLGNKSPKKFSHEENLSDSSCNSNHPRCQPLSKAITKNLLQRHKEKSNLNLDLKSIEIPSSNSLNGLKSTKFSKNDKMKENILKDSNYKNISDSNSIKNKKQEFLEERKEYSDSFDFSDFSNKSVCNTGLVHENSTEPKCIIQTKKHALITECDKIDQNYLKNEVKNTGIKLQNPVKNFQFHEKIPKNSRIMEDITNKVNMKHCGSHNDQIVQNLKEMFKSISQNSSTPNPNMSNISFNMGTNVSSIKMSKEFEINKHDFQTFNSNVRDNNYKINNNSSFDISNISHISIISSNNIAMKSKDDKSCSSLVTCGSFISDLNSQRNDIEGRNTERKFCGPTKLNRNSLKHKIDNWLSNNENDNSINFSKNSLANTSLPLLDNNCNDLQKNTSGKSCKKYKIVKNKMRTCESKEIKRHTTKKLKKPTYFQSKTQAADSVSQMQYENKISKISSVVVSQTNSKCEDWCSGISSNDHFSSSNLSDGTDNGVIGNNISISSELQNVVSSHLKTKFQLAEKFSTHVLTVLQNNFEEMKMNNEKVWKSSIHKYKMQIEMQLCDAATVMDNIEQQMSDLKNVENIVKQISESLEPKFQLALEKIQLLHQTNKNMLKELSSLNEAGLKPNNQLEETMEYFQTLMDKTLTQQSVNSLETIKTIVSKMLFFE